MGESAADVETAVCGDEGGELWVTCTVVFN
jgi:hypothetical protein